MDEDPKKLHAPELPGALAQQKPDGTLDIRKIQYPGKINVASERGIHGHFGGCAAIEFGGVIAMNEWFAAHPGLLLVDWRPSYGSHVVALYTRTLTDEEIAEYNEINEEVARTISERRETEAKLKEENEAKVKEAEEKLKKRADDEYKELKRLAELGRRHEKNCGKEKR